MSPFSSCGICSTDLMTAPIVTVVLPTFNRLKYLRVAVASVYAQTIEDWELIVVDDGSDEPTREFLRSPPDSRMNVVFHPHTGVPAIIRNQGIARARGRYVAFLDSDDQWAADKLQRQLELMESEPRRRWSYTASRRVDADGRVMNVRHTCAPYSGSIVEQILRLDATIATPTVMAELALVRELGGFDEKMRFAEDYDLWARLALRSEVSYESRPLVDIRTHEEQFSVGGDSSDGWVRLYAKMESLVPTRRLRSLCRRRKRDYLLSLAAQHARASDWVGMRQVLAAAVRAHAWGLRGWLRIAKAVAVSGREKRRRSPVAGGR